MSSARTAIAALVLALFGGLLLALGLVIDGLVHTHLESKVPAFVSLTDNTSAVYRVWAGGPDGVQQYISYYFFNVTNANAVISRLAIPHLSLVGPFTYTLDQAKANITRLANTNDLQYIRNANLTYYNVPCPPNATFHWTGGPPCSIANDTLVYTANVPLLAIIQQINQLAPLQAEVAALFIDFVNKRFGNEDLLPPIAAQDIIFGYNDTIVRQFDVVVAEYNRLFNRSLVLRNEFFALQPQTSPNISRISTDPASPGVYHMWNGYAGTLDYWGNGSCAADGPALSRLANAINGTEGALFAPRPPEALQLFSEALFRSATLVHTSDTSYRGIAAARYTLDPGIFTNTTFDHDACVFDADGLAGVINISYVVGAPLFLSNPLFTGADPGYLKNVTGLENYEAATTEYDVDPWTGVTLRSHTRLQLNAHITPWERLDATRWIHPGGYYLPVMVVEQRTVVSDAFVKAWQEEFGNALNGAATTRLAALIVGAFTLAIALSLATVSAARWNFTPETEHLPENEPLLAHIDINA